jgi:hypothetical protein
MKVAANYAERNWESTILMFRQKAAETRKLYGFHTAEKGVRKCR